MGSSSARAVRLPPILPVLVAVLLAVSASFGAAQARGQAAEPSLGRPDRPPVAPTIAEPPATPPPDAATPPSTESAAPASPSTPAPVTPSPATPATPAATAPGAAAPSARAGAATAAAAAAAKARARAVQQARLRQARARRAAVMRAARGLQDDLAGAAVVLTAADALPKAAEGRSAGASAVSAVTEDSGRGSTLALMLLALSGVTAGVALLPRRSLRVDDDRPGFGFVERHRLELAGISTSCLLVALLVFAGLI